MIVYITLLLVCLASLLVYRKTGQRIWAVIPYISMAFVGGFRNGAGVDFASYQRQFFDIAVNRGWSVNFEPGFRLLVNVIYDLGLSYQVMFLLIQCATCYFYFRFIEDNSIDFELSTVLFLCLGPFYFSSYNAIRQALAMSVFLYSLKYVNYNMKRYSLHIFMASFFHFSALVFLVFPAVRWIGKNYLFYLILGISMVCICFHFHVIDLVVSTFFSERARLLDFNANMDKSYMLYLFICVFGIVAEWKMRLKIEKNMMYLVVFTCILIFCAFLYPEYSMILTRFVSYGTPVLLILIPRMKKIVRQERIYKMVLYGFCFLYYFRLILSPGAHLIPYAFNFVLTM